MVIAITFTFYFFSFLLSVDHRERRWCRMHTCQRRFRPLNYIPSFPLRRLSSIRPPAGLASRTTNSCVCAWMLHTHALVVMRICISFVGGRRPAYVSLSFCAIKYLSGITSFIFTPIPSLPPFSSPRSFICIPCTREYRHASLPPPLAPRIHSLPTLRRKARQCQCLSKFVWRPHTSSVPFGGGVFVLSKIRAGLSHSFSTLPTLSFGVQCCIVHHPTSLRRESPALELKSSAPPFLLPSGNRSPIVVCICVRCQ